MSPSDAQQFELITRFKSALEPERGKCFDELMSQLCTSVMPRWMITKKVVEPVLDALALRLDQVAYLNLVKFHTTGTNLHKGLFDNSWSETDGQIALLGPTVIVVLGLSTASAFRRYSGASRRHIVTRHKGDTRLPKPAEVSELAMRERENLRVIYE
jgi:hypothetical protein